MHQLWTYAIERPKLKRHRGGTGESMEPSSILHLWLGPRSRSPVDWLVNAFPFTPL